MFKHLIIMIILDIFLMSVYSGIFISSTMIHGFQPTILVFTILWTMLSALDIYKRLNEIFSHFELKAPKNEPNKFSRW